MITDPATLQQVRSTPLFSELDSTHLSCIEPGDIINLANGTVLISEGERSPFFFVVLEGEIRLSRTYDRQTVLMGVIKSGEYTGEITLLLDIAWMATARVGKPAKLFRLGQEDFWHMMGTCRSVARKIFYSAANKVRNLEGYSLQREKLTSLGTMAAGLAHELNNPAAAARRAAAHLQETTDKIQTLLCQLTRTLEHEQMRHMVTASQDALERLKLAPALDHLERSDRADAIAIWLETHGVAAAWEIAPVFVNAGVDIAWLEEFAGKLPPANHPEALGWLEARLSLKSLIGQVEQSAGRISELVKAVKSYSRMDQSAMQEVDIHDGLESTLTMLGHKLKSITLIRAYDRSVPRIMAYGSELNQVWTNLIDNAIYAVNGTGKICIGTCLEDNQLVVEIVDNGAGIPPEIQPHLFEPFFTTKPVGTGTGLGLIISNRIVADRHGGEIEFESKPGETRFKVRLHLAHPADPVK
ncbi:MAG TPA: ATP-binding protein [Verrucomicrobiae bacterium]|nr:ATP-binding protein [Verrucomicrobiae bacterium]